ncbi:LCP family protein [Nocardia sp. NPDC127579]|uniref:LCP family protein n=1 Tax=Nocardia sp. NPDC127579 TaxID=3345402 RepID=UPI0036347499
MTGERSVSRGRVFLAAGAVLVLVLTGFAWRSIDSLVSGIERISDLGLGGERDGATDILLVGVDSRTDAHGNPLSDRERALLHAGDEVGMNTDTIMLVRVPNDGRSATAISIPRDSYVQVPGIGQSKINSAYGATKVATKEKLLAQGESETQAEAQSVQAGRQALIKSVGSLTGLTVDHYAEVSFLGFVLLTDAVGGVEVCLNEAVDEWMSGADFPAGRQRLNGPEALSFVRQRHNLPRGDIDRIVRQQVFLAQLTNQMLSAKTLSNPIRLQQLSDAVGRTVVLDGSWDVLSFLKQLKDLSSGQVSFETIPVADLNGMTNDGESVVRVEPRLVQAFVSSLVDEQGAEIEDIGFDPATVTVNVLNAGGVGGLAAKVSQALAAKGFQPGQIGNYNGGTVSGTRVLAASSDNPKAEAIATALGGLTVVADPMMSPDAISVVLAGDYSGPGSSANSMFDFTGSSSGSATPVPPAPPISAGGSGPKCVN